MSRLLSADFSKLKKNKLFLICLVGMFLLELFLKITDCINAGQSQPILRSMLFTYVLIIGFLIAALDSLFVGTEYSDGTIRNKLIVGHKRESIYLSNLITCSAGGVLLCLSYFVPALIVGIPFCGIESGDLKTIFLVLLGSLFMSLSFTSLCTMAGMLFQNKAHTAILTILGVCFFFVVSIYITGQLNISETIPTVIQNGNEIVKDVGTELNPAYVGGVKRAVYQFLNNVLPTSQAITFWMSSYDATSVFLSLYSVGVIIVTTVIGVCVFKKRDIK